MSECDYPYARGNLLEDRNTYTYTSFGGLPFLDAWLADRRRVQAELSEPSFTEQPTFHTGRPEFRHDASIDTRPLMDAIMSDLAQGTISADLRPWMNWLIQRFEVTKRLYGAYIESGKPLKAGDFQELELYVRFGELLAAAYELEPKLPYVNALLKCMDSLCALSSRLDSYQQGRLSRLIDFERTIVSGLAESQSVHMGRGAA